LRTERGYQLATTLMFLTMFALVVAASLRATDGKLVYSLDDPYIHLAVAENILHRGYGVNDAEFSSPSSSILFPFLLAVALAVGLGDWGPLLISGAAVAVTVWLVSGFLWRYAIDEQSARSRLIGYLMAPSLVLSINAVALPMTGMEHSLHVLACVLVVIGLTDLKSAAPVPWYFVVGILLSPLLRFEGVPLALAGILALLWRRHALVAFASAATLALVFAFWAYAMLSLDLPILPSSILVKSEPIRAAVDEGVFHALRTIATAVRQSFSNTVGVTFFAAIVLVLVSVVLLRRGGAERGLVATAALMTLGAHLAFGRYGWFFRYEVYAVAVMILSLIYLFSGVWKDAGRMVAAKQLLLVLLLVLPANHYARAALRTPSASRNIYEQQFQMHRFATEYFPHAVAVNDLGWVAYQNDGYVLDLWGLGSEEARRMRTIEGHTPASMEHLTRRKGVKYAMLYESWLGDAIPGTWCRTAVLNTSWVTAGSAEVAFYLIDPSLFHEMVSSLAAFRGSLPKGATLAILPCAERASDAHGVLVAGRLQQSRCSPHKPGRLSPCAREARRFTQRRRHAPNLVR
jgi:hypothetical protein